MMGYCLGFGGCEMVTLWRTKDCKDGGQRHDALVA